MSTTIRLIVLALMVILAWGFSLMLRGTLSAESLPDWRLDEFPMDLSLEASDGSVTSWHGMEHKKMDPVLTQALNADDWVDLVYRDGAGGAITLHMAAFKQYQFGVAHNPMVCYNRGGWKQKGKFDLDLEVANSKGGKKNEKETISVKAAAWEHKKRGRAMIAYWYQLGDDLVFDRGSLGTTRMKYLGEPFRPALIKFLLHTTYTTSSDKEVARERLKAMSEHVYDWINQPGHDWVPQKKPQ